MHAELAKCEEAEDQLEYAVTHLRKALELDDSGQYYDRLQTALTRLQLRATLYKTPERPEDLAAMIIEQVGTLMVRFRFQLVSTFTCQIINNVNQGVK